MSSAENNNKESIIAGYIIVFVLLNSLGFPGRYTRVFGSSFGVLVEYTSFLLQILLMLMTSSDRLLDIKIVDLKGKYWSVYCMLAVITVCSMIVTIDRKAEIISCVRMSTTALFGLWIVDHYPIRRILEILYFAQMIFVFLSVVFVTVFHAYSVTSGSYAGYYNAIFGTKNEAGMELALGITFQMLLYRIYRDEKKEISTTFLGFLVVQCILLFLTKSTGAIFVTAVPTIYILHFEQKWGIERRIPLGYFYVIASVGFIVFALTIIPLFAPVLEAMGEDPTLTGRVPLWNQAIKIMQESHTFTGYGYGMFWFNDYAVDLMHAGFDKYSWAGNMRAGCHNVILELWLNVGLLGIASYFVMVLDSMKRIREMGEHQYLFCFIFMISFTIFGFTERAFGTYQYHTLFIFMTAGIGCSRDLAGSALRVNDQEEVLANEEG